MDAFIVDGKYVEKYEITNLTTKPVKLLVLYNYKRIYNNSIYSTFILYRNIKRKNMHFLYSTFNRSSIYICIYLLEKSALPSCTDQSDLNTPDLVIMNSQ